MNLNYLKHNLDYMYDYVYIIYACLCESFGGAPCNYLFELPPQEKNLSMLLDWWESAHPTLLDVAHYEFPHRICIESSMIHFFFHFCG